MDNAMDPELASEMVKLLAQELKVVRAQLREAERVGLENQCNFKLQCELTCVRELSLPQA
jgi:hypothetical protein